MTLEEALFTQLSDGICDRGNHVLTCTEDNKSVLFSRVSKDYVFQASYTPSNYPSWQCSVITLTEKELKDHICTKLVGWEVTKSQFEDLPIDDSNRIMEAELMDADNE